MAAIRLASSTGGDNDDDSDNETLFSAEVEATALLALAFKELGTMTHQQARTEAISR